MVPINDIPGGVEILETVVHAVGVEERLGSQEVGLDAGKRVDVFCQSRHRFQTGGDQERVQVQESEIQLCLLIQIASEHIGKMDEVRVNVRIDEVTLHDSITLGRCQNVTHTANVSHEERASMDR